MGLSDMFGKNCVCPQCRHPGARKFLGRVKCRNVNCTNYDSAFAQSGGAPGETDIRPTAPLPHFAGIFDAGSNRLEIRYRNHLGAEHTYVGDRRTLRRRGQYISMCIVPTGKRVSFALKWILSPSRLPENAGATEAAAPTGAERRVLSYHSKKGTTSALYENLLRKYPDY